MESIFAVGYTSNHYNQFIFRILDTNIYIYTAKFFGVEPIFAVGFTSNHYNQLIFRVLDNNIYIYTAKIFGLETIFAVDSLYPCN